MNWYAIYTKPRSEDAVAALLLGAGIETLNPCIRTRRYFRKQYQDIIEPLFPCYIFARLDHTLHGHMITYTRGVRYIVGKERPLLVPDEIIASIQDRMEDGIIGSPAEQFEKGERIIINDGPFRDFSGVFERDLPGKDRVVILLNALHGSLELDRGALRKLP